MPIGTQIAFDQKLGIPTQHHIGNDVQGFATRGFWARELSDSGNRSLPWSQFGPGQDPVQDQVYAAPWCSSVLLHSVYSKVTILLGQTSKATRIHREKSSAIKS